MRRRTVRKIKHIFKRFFAFILSICFLILFFKGAQYLFYSPYFSIKDIKIESSSEDLNYISEICEVCRGKNIFRFNSKILKEELAKNSKFKEIKIKKRLPNTLIISVERRQPIASLLKNGKIFGVDEEGVLFPIEQELFPIVCFSEENTKLICKFLKELKESFIFYPEIKEVKANNSQIYLFTSDYEIKWGEVCLDDLLKEKINNLNYVISDCRKRGLAIEYIDLRFFSLDKKNIIIKPI